MNQLLNQIEHRASTLLWLMIAILSVWTFAHHFLMDDALISFRYAKNLTDGYGLVWNIGEPIEGYTNFLWVILCAVGLKLGIAPEKFSVLLNVPLFIFTLFLTYRIALKILASKYEALFAVLLTGITRSIYGFATSGLETTLQAVELLALVALLIHSQRFRSTSWAMLTSCLVALMFLTRPDAAVPFGVMLFVLWSERRELSTKIRLILLGPVVIVGILYAVWKISHFGVLLPNSFQTKVRDLSGLGYGIFYIHQFLLSHLLYPFLFLTIWKIKDSNQDNYLSTINIIVGAWAVYVIAVGGDFMEFRFLVPVIPLFYIMIIKALNFMELVSVRMALYTGMFFGVIHGNFAMEKLVFGYGIESVNHLKGHLSSPKENWSAIGRKLGEYFGGSNVVIAAGAAGAIPYYSGLKTIDFMGLNDLTIPKEGVPFSNVPGHKIISSLDYLVKRNVNLIIEPINHMMTNQEFAAWSRQPSWREMPKYFINPDGLVNGKQINVANLIGIPIDKDYVLVAWYLTPSLEVETVIVEKGWTKVEVTRW